MFSGCGKAGLVYVLAVCALMMSGCLSVTSTEQVESNMRDLADNYTDVNEVRAVWSAKSIVTRDYALNATPILAAIVLGDIERVSKLIGNGASVKYVEGTSISPLECASFIDSCQFVLQMREEFYNDISYSGVSDVNVPLMRLLLDNGADPDEENRYGVSVREKFLCFPSESSSFVALDVFYEYSGKVSKEIVVRCKEKIERVVKYLDESRGLKSSSMNVISMGGEEGINKRVVQARKNYLLLEDFGRYGQKKAFSIWENPDQYFAVALERKERDEAERKRQQEIAQKKFNAKKKAINSYIASRPDLSQAMDEVVQIGAEKKAVDSFLRGNMFGHLCETGSNNTFYQSKTCLSEWEVVRRQARSHKSSLDAAYKKQRDWFAGLFGQNAGVAAAVVDDRVASTPSDKNVKQQYAPIEQQLIRITESEARAERAESRRREQQQMADFMNHIQTTFDRTNRMLDRNMAQTHRVVNQAYASQRVRDVKSSSGYRERSAPAMRDLDKKLEEIDHSFDVSASGRSEEESPRQIAASPSNAGKKECIAQSESTGPKPNVPKRYCQYVFADYTDNASFGLDDYISEFMEESHSEESAKESLAFELLQEAKKKCKSKGYSRVHHNETYEFNEVAVTVGQCKENNRMGSTFYLCGGTASFICAR